MENRPVSPLYDAVRDILAGSWPEDEYDANESPLSHADYKSQVSLEVVEPPVASAAGAATDTDFESLKSDDESEWYAGPDETMETDVDVEANTDMGVDILAGIDRRTMRRSIVEESFEGNFSDIAARIDAVVEGTVVEEVGSGIGATKAKRASTYEMAEGFRAEIAEELHNAFGSAEEDEVDTSVPNDQPEIQKAAEKTNQTPQMRLIIPNTSFQAPIEELEPPPIPSRSPSRPGTALANRRHLEAPDIFSAPQASESTTSLQQLKTTISSMSSPRSSRFFEDLGDQATTTATSVDISSPLHPKRLESGYSATRGAPKVQAKKRKGGFSCGLRFLFGKSGKPKKSGSSDNARPISTSTTSTIKI